MSACWKKQNIGLACFSKWLHGVHPVKVRSDFFDILVMPQFKYKIQDLSVGYFSRNPACRIPEITAARTRGPRNL